MSVDAVSGGDIDPSHAVTSLAPFVVDLHIGWGGAVEDRYTGYEAVVKFDDAVLAFVPTRDLDMDGQPESWDYTGLGAMVLDIPVSRFDEDGDTLIDTLWGASARTSGTTDASGPAVNASFRCVGNGTSLLHLVSSAENSERYTTTLAWGGGDVATNLRDASITCSLDAPTPTATPPPAVGGIAELPDMTQGRIERAVSPAGTAESLARDYRVVAGGIVAAMLVVTVGAWHARRRRPR
jgi:hypothetical protein